MPPAVTGGAWTENFLHNFTGGNDGVEPEGSKLVFDKAGNFYGTTRGNYSIGSTCDTSNCGAVFELSPPAAGSSDWSETILHAFPATAKDGADPISGVMLGKHGELYGVTPIGGAGGEGAVYMVVP